MSETVPRAGEDAPEWPDPLWLLNVKTGTSQKIHLPYYDNHSPVSIAIVQQPRNRLCDTG